jgi:glutathione S-transferase
MLKVWGRATSVNVQKVMWAVGEMGIAHDRIDVGGRFGGLTTPAFLAMNPNGRVPTIEDDGVVVSESNAIIRYLAARHSMGMLWERDPGTRAQADAWMDWMQTTLAPDFYGVFWAVVRTPADRQDRTAIKDLTERLTGHFELLDRQLATRPYLVADRFSLADIAVGVTLYRYFEMEIDRPALSNLREWHNRLKERPAFRDHVMISFEELRG